MRFDITRKEAEDLQTTEFNVKVRDASVEEAASYLLSETTGLDLDGEHGEKTPARFVAVLKELTTPEPFEFTTFDNEQGIDEMVVMTDVPFVTLCNHHVVPFYGVAHVGYIPGPRICGLSKLARTVEMFARRLNIQEVMTNDIADYLEEVLAPLGVAVVLKAEHMCMSIRGARVRGATTTTSAMRGVFADHSRTAKAEFFEHLRRD